jgi:transcriptional regulator with GAF, ATPase, and Fis domain
VASARHAQRRGLTRAGVETLQSCDCPGNIRELRNVIERAAIFARGGALEFDLTGTDSSTGLTSLATREGDEVEPEYLTESEVRRRERDNLLAVLEESKALTEPRSFWE